MQDLNRTKPRCRRNQGLHGRRYGNDESVIPAATETRIRTRLRTSPHAVRQARGACSPSCQRVTASRRIGAPDGSARCAPFAGRVRRGAARDARRRLREQGIVPIEADCRVGVMLGQDELLVAVRRAVALERRRPCPPDPAGLGGDLYVTTRRLLHLGQRPIAYELDAIREVVVAGDQLLLVLDDGMGLAISVDDPRLLRVEIAAARAAARVESRARRWPGAVDEDETP